MSVESVAGSAEETLVDATSSRPKLLLNISTLFSPTYLTIVSIIQGVELSYLAQVVDSQFGRFDTAHWIAVCATFFLVVAIWQEYMMNTMIFMWIPTLVDSLFVFGLGAVEFLVMRALNADLHTWLLM